MKITRYQKNNNDLKLLLLFYLPFTIFGVSHSYPKLKSLDIISHIIYHTLTVFISLNPIQPPLLRSSLFFTSFIFIIVLTAYDFSLLITCPNYKCLIYLLSLILSSINTPLCFLFCIHSLSFHNITYPYEHFHLFYIYSLIHFLINC